MPIYEYSCTSCGNKFDLLRPISRSDEDAKCPECHKKAKRAISAFASFSKDAYGVSAPISGGGADSSCGSCSSSACSPG